MTTISTRFSKKKPNLFLKRTSIILLIIAVSITFFYNANRRNAVQAKNVIIVFTKDGPLEVETDKVLVIDILKEANIILNKETQRVLPELEEEIATNFITIEDAKKISLKVDGEVYKLNSWAKTIADLLEENGIILNGDFVNLPLDEKLVNGQQIVIVRVKSELVHEEIPIPAQITYRNDSSLTLGKEKVHTAPREGIKRITYEIVYNDGKEVSRKRVKEEIIKPPVAGVVLRGTQALVSRSGPREGIKHYFLGQASFYGSKFHGRSTRWGEIYDKHAMTAASRDLPHNTMVRVTNLENGKSVIVRINDYGPSLRHPERIIDLSEAAFKQIANITVGVITEVKVEVVNGN